MKREDPSTNGKDCKHEPGAIIPIINRNRCEGKEDCVQACPYAVFRVDILPRDQRSALSLLGKLKGYGHGWKQAFAVNADACHGCGKCVAACPEKAITLIRATAVVPLA